MIVFTGMLLILSTVTMPIYDRARADAEKITKLADAREAANTIANALNTVYASGVGAKHTVEYWLPNGILSISFVDGTENRVDVKIELNFESDSVVQIGTILPSGDDENRVIVDNENFEVSSALYRMDFTYKYLGNLRYIEIKVA